MRALRALCAAALVLPLAGAHAFKLQALGAIEQPLGEAGRQARGFRSLFGSDVHERITRQAYEKAGAKLADDVIAGVRWSDNPPPMRLGPLSGSCNARCWAGMMRVDRMAFEFITRREQSVPALRSHFGDMQFLHAMATRSGEAPADTRANALRWAEFSYRVARGEIAGGANVFELRETASTMDPATAAWLSALFRSPAKQLWRVQDVFLPAGADLRLFAFGTFLHLVEDSYSASHVVRATKRRQPNGCPSYQAGDAIVEFHTYVGQDTEKHALCDDAPDWLTMPRAGGPVDALADLVRAYEEGRDWAFMKALLEARVFMLAPGAAAARPGACFESRPDAALDGPATAAPTALEPNC